MDHQASSKMLCISKDTCRLKGVMPLSLDIRLILHTNRNRLQAQRGESGIINEVENVYEDHSRRECHPQNSFRTKEASRELFKRLREESIIVARNGVLLKHCAVLIRGCSLPVAPLPG